MAFNSLLKLLLELPNQASWAHSTSEVNLNQQQVGFGESLGGVSLLKAGLYSRKGAILCRKGVEKGRRNRMREISA